MATLTLQDRVQEARKGIRFAKILKRDRFDRPTSILVPGSESKRYEVLIKRPGSGMMVCECFLDTPGGHKRCPGSLVSVCYHMMMALTKAAEEKGLHVSFVENEIKADKLVNLSGGKAKKIEVASRWTTRRLWAVVS